ncbi:MAG: type II restriction endonuclease [Bacteroidetes bacterium]|nr:MAG: type II restriction endonuclease [Bacteroidota bacterium]
MKTFADGSKIAKAGFENEYDIINRFNNWRKDKEAQSWLEIMNYKLSEIEYVEAIKVSGFKTDVQVQVTIKLKKAIDVENLQVKLESNKTGFNQIDKRWVDKYAEMWNIPDNIVYTIKRYTGEIKPTIKKTRYPKRMLANEFTLQEQIEVIDWLKKNQALIISDVIKGRGKFAAECMLVAQKIILNSRWILKPINYCINFYGNGEVRITSGGNFRISKIGMQRKGGDSGRESAKLLQFKIDPSKLFEE